MVRWLALLAAAAEEEISVDTFDLKWPKTQATFYTDGWRCRIVWREQGGPGGTIDNHGLSAAICSLVSKWSEQTGIPVDLEVDPALGRLPEAIELSVFRIVQEGLSNIRKHAAATQVTLTLQRTPTASLLMRLVDNGHGMVAPMNLAALAEQKHFGLVGISERVSLLNGTLAVNSLPDGGLELAVEIPSPYPSISP